MTRDDLFNINAGIVKNLVSAAAKHCPEVGEALYLLCWLAWGVSGAAWS
jgi:malate/lactate dehydrogenase